MPFIWLGDMVPIIILCVRICMYIFMCAYLGVDLFVCMGAWAVVFIFNSGLQGWED